ncbi:MAG: ATP-binding protein [Cyanobacteriota bacterium]|nr:ATP-binding protein [Cyanobacteriota bacterium]
MRLVRLLSQTIARQRLAGRTSDSDAWRGMAIEEGEAERLVDQLTADLHQAIATPGAGAIHATTPAGASVDPLDTPLRRVKRLYGLGDDDWIALLFALAVELDSRFARLAAFLNDHIARTRPTIGTCLLLSGTGLDAVAFSQRPALRHGLLQTEGEGPLSSLALRLAPEMLARLAGGDADPPLPQGLRHHRPSSPRLADLLADPGQKALLKRWSARLNQAEPPPPLVLVGAEGAGRATFAACAAAEAGYGLLRVAWSGDWRERWRLAVREALWHHALPLIQVGEEATPDDMASLWELLAPWRGPVALAIPPRLEESLEGLAEGSASVLVVKRLDSARRQRLWQRLLSGEAATLTEAEREALALRHDLLPGQMAKALRLARAQRPPNEDASSGEFERLCEACRVTTRGAMGPLAQRLPPSPRREDLVLTADLENELDLAIAWMRHRRRVFEDWGFSHRLGRGQGLTALFGGAPGTGKTMAAQVLARDLGLELYRVDLSKVMSKYIGETEKHLARLFDEAQASEAILFFDEADALFGKRTEVKDAHDRYANLEISYLLQRMEEHAGTTILATNRMRDLDEAFRRRFHFILDFQLPLPPERRRIWAGMLPPQASREEGLDLDQLANNYEVSGGEIRNSVISAAFLAASEGVPIGMRHLRRGLRRELLKVGRVLDPDQRLELERD